MNTKNKIIIAVLLGILSFNVAISKVKAVPYPDCYVACTKDGGTHAMCDSKCVALDPNYQTINGVTITNPTTTSTTANHQYYETHGALDPSTGQMVYAQPGTLPGAIATAGSDNFNYKLLESFPGFFSAGTTMTNLPEFILAIYKFGIWTIGIAGLFMLIIGGFMYMGSAGNNSTATSAKGIIFDSLIGIVAALSSYLFLYVINPDLVRIRLDFTPVYLGEAEEAEVAGESVSGSLVTRNGYQIDSAFDAALVQIKQESGVNAIVTSGLRSLQKQQDLIRKNCGGFPATRTCAPPTCLLKNGPESCPHTTGRAVDIWATNESGQQAIMQKACMSNISACFENPYQKKLIAAMKAKGFCVLSSEPWHFEKPKMSSRCVF